MTVTGTFTRVVTHAPEIIASYVKRDRGESKKEARSSGRMEMLCAAGGIGLPGAGVVLATLTGIITSDMRRSSFRDRFMLVNFVQGMGTGVMAYLYGAHSPEALTVGLVLGGASIMKGSFKSWSI